MFSVINDFGIGAFILALLVTTHFSKCCENGLCCSCESAENYNDDKPCMKTWLSLKRKEHLIESHYKFGVINFMPNKSLVISDGYKKAIICKIGKTKFNLDILSYFFFNLCIGTDTNYKLWDLDVIAFLL